MKILLQHISLKTVILFFVSLLCLLLAGGVSFCEQHIKRGLADQQMAKRWSADNDAVQVSAFFSEGAVEDSQYFKQIKASVDQALVTASITQDSVNENARLWMDAVSRTGKATLVSDRGSVEVKVMGVEGDFFQFHPVHLVSGSYFSQANLMRDGVIIDEETAWQLFGSNDIAGMQIAIAGVPHFITGVYKRTQGRIEEAAGLDKSVCFLSLDSLQKYGQPQSGYYYDIVLPNPIKGFGLSTMNRVLAADTTEVKVVENSTRYDILPLLGVIKSFGIRSMSYHNIIYPYWENIARGYEDILAVCLLIKSILLSIPSILFILAVIYLYRHRTWSFGSFILWLKDKHYEMGTKRMMKKHGKEQGQQDASEEKHEENQDALEEKENPTEQQNKTEEKEEHEENRDASEEKESPIEQQDALEEKEEQEENRDVSEEKENPIEQQGASEEEEKKS